MEHPKPATTPAVGFLTVLEHPEHGLFGGYLLLNPAARPLEFHCTAPIKPNRAQQILYGPTLESFLYGEQIGQTLLGAAKLQAGCVCTDQVPTLSVRDHVPLPLVLLVTSVEHNTGREGPTLRLDGAHHSGPGLASFQLGRHRLALLQRFDQDRQAVTRQLGQLGESFDLAEPFQRIREAIREAQQAAWSSSCSTL